MIGPWIVCGLCLCFVDPAPAPSAVQASGTSTADPGMPSPAGPPKRPAPGAVATWVEQLADPLFSVREAAQNRLLTADPDLLPWLQNIYDSTSSWEVRSRLETVIATLKRRQTQLLWLNAPLLDLNFQKTPLRQAVAQLNQQTRVRIVLDDTLAQPDRPITIQAPPQPVWQALEQFRIAAGLSEFLPAEPTAADNRTLATRNPGLAYARKSNPANASPSRPEIHWTDASAPAPRLIFQGTPDARSLFRVRALPAHYPLNRRIRGAGVTLLHLDIQNLSEHEWQPTEGILLRAAEDDQGRPLPVRNIQEESLYPSDDPVQGLGNRVMFNANGFAFPRQVSRFRPQATATLSRVSPMALPTDERPTPYLNYLEGVLRGRFKLRQQAVATIENLPTATGQVVTLPDQTTLTVRQYQLNEMGTILTIKIYLTAPNPWMLAQAQGFRLGPVSSLWDADGLGSSTLKQFQFKTATNEPVPQGRLVQSSSSDNGQEQTSELEIRFQKRPQSPFPTKLVILGDRWVPVEVPFYLKQVELP